MVNNSHCAFTMLWYGQCLTWQNIYASFNVNPPPPPPQVDPRNVDRERFACQNPDSANKVHCQNQFPKDLYFHHFYCHNYVRKHCCSVPCMVRQTDPCYNPVGDMLPIQDSLWQVHYTYKVKFPIHFISCYVLHKLYSLPRLALTIFLIQQNHGYCFPFKSNTFLSVSRISYLVILCFKEQRHLTKSIN